MITLSLFRPDIERPTMARVPSLTRLVEALEAWQMIRAARVIKQYSRPLATTEGRRDVAATQTPHDA